jgi:hypothetical protein
MRAFCHDAVPYRNAAAAGANARFAGALNGSSLSRFLQSSIVGAFPPAVVICAFRFGKVRDDLPAYLYAIQ